MVRSKFPGKPSKLINRKLTRASTASAIQENEATKTAEEINHGLKIFKGIFGFDEEDKGSEFLGFSPHEVLVARDKSRTRHFQVEEEYKARGVLYEPYSAGKTTLLPACSANKKEISCGKKVYSQKNSEESCLSDKKPNEPSSSSSVGKADTLPVFKVSVTNSSKENNFVRTNRCNAFKVRPSIPDTQDKGGGVQFDNKKKFVLPSRSVHSSRVIKPNKRFLDTDLNIASSGAGDNNDAGYPGIKLKKAKLIVDTPNEGSPFTWCNNKVRKEGASNSVTGDEVINNPSDPCSSVINTVNNGSNENSDNNSSATGITTTTTTITTTTATTVSTTTTTITTATITSQPGAAGGKVIIRKARLKIDNELPTLKGPFSEKFENPKHAPGTVVCGVCGAVRFYRFVKQTRKFGIYSCEACRKFISRMVRETHVSSSLQCLQGDGKCVVPLIMTTLKWTSARNRIPRCEACWLKMCLQCYCMPEDLRDRLTGKLPKSMHQDFKFELSSEPKSIPKLVPKDNDMSGNETSTNRQRRRAAINSLVNIARFTGRFADETMENQLLIARNLKKKATAMMRREAQMNYANKKDLVRFSVNEDILMKSIKTYSKRDLSRTDCGDFKTNGIMSAKENLNSGVVSMTDPKKKKKRKIKNDEKTGRRQRISIKGPRVKHVCRSASLVLGQPVATFNSAMSPLKNKANSTKELDGEQTMSVSPVIEISQNIEITETVNGKPSEHSCVRMRQPSDVLLHKEEPPPTKASRAVSAQSKPLARTLQDLGRQNCELLDGVPETGESAVVSIDFWESYDPEEVCKTGFALIGSDASFKARALCFLCGSAGLDRLIHCACCCEPYHRYCVEGGDFNKNEDKGWWRVDWVCPRCTLCNACGLGSGPQVSCQRCHKSYHTECLAADRLANRLHSADRPWVCPSCLRCKSCNLAAVYKFIGNLPLCRGCFKLRQRGNFCPLCQRCYEDNDFDTKMMECSQCKCWVHAKCEGLSNEKYQVLSFLPESVEFVCRMCCEMPPAPWWLAVEAEMKVGYLSVLKALSKNRKACDLLKWSPKKQSPVCVCRGGARQRTLRFPELSEQSDAESSDLRTSSCDTQRDEEVLSNEDECLQKSVKQNNCLDAESSVNLVSESKDLSVDERTSSLCELRLKYRDSSVLRPNAEEELHLKLDSDTQLLNIPYQSIDGKTAQFSPHATSQSDSGIASTDDELKSTTAEQCFCLGLDPWTKTSPTLLTVKKKVNSNEYSSLLQFHQEMQHVINSVQGLELLDLYYQTLQDVFPWFDPKCSQVYDSRKESSIAQTEFNESTESINNERTENCDEDVSVILKNLLDLSEEYYYSDYSLSDTRICVLCKTVGEGKTTYEGRLLYCGHNEWVHANCALWSNEVFEEIDGSLQNVHSAVSRSRHIRCSGCGKKGASVGCCNRNCPEAYHFPCARAGRCVFMENKTVYCLAHQSEADDSKPLVDDSDYPVSRPVYVELERKKKKFVPRQDVRLMVGSLTIESIGEFVPDVSDQENTIMPCEFYCTRLFWSSFEPWRIVKYHIRTKVIHSVLEYSAENDFNYTVDHSRDDDITSRNEKLSPEKEVVREVNENDVKQVLENIVEIICSREDEGCLSDPQNPADLLPPELKDAIFEDIPHDLLDGISMQDIFPKLMSYDDISVDTKGDKEYKSDSNSDIESLHAYNSKKTKYDSYENSVENNLYKNSNHVAKVYSVQSEEKRKYSKRYFNRRRNCDTTSNQLISVGNHENKIEEKENAVKWQRPQILQVDGAGDCSSESDTGSPSNEELCYTPVLHVTIKESQHTVDKSSSPTSITSNSDQCIWQVDGTADYSSSSSSGSESGSPLREEDCNWKLIEQLDGQADCSSSEEGEEKPVKCAQCHRTYRTAQSYERHLQTCSVDYILSCSESDSSEEEKTNSPVGEVVENDMLAPNTLYTVSETKSVSEDGSLQASVPEIRECAPTLSETISDCKMDISNLPFETLYSQVDEIKMSVYPENSESQNCGSGNDISDNFPNINCVYSEQNCHKINGLLHSNVETIVNNNALPDRICQVKPKAIRAVSENFEYSNRSSVSPSPKTSPIRNRTPRTYTRCKKGVTTVTPVITSPVTTSQPHQIIEYQPTAVSGAPALILHQVPTQNVIPAYVDASYTQQSSAHNIQYIATIDPQDKTQYLAAANPIIPATYHLQTTPLGIQSVVPTVVGTIIQPNGVEQLVVNTPAPTVEVISQNPTSGMFITSPPMYVGMETVVSNTVMSSSQFVSGMLAASSYSATTTQVFQTAKPVVDLAQGYVIVNTQPPPAPTAIPQTQTMFQPPAQTPFPWSCNYQEAYKFKERTTYQAVTRQIIREEKKMDCLQMVNATQKTIVIEQPVTKKVDVKSEPPRFAQQRGPVHELSRMVDNFCTKKQVTPQKRKCTGISSGIIKCPPVTAQVNQKVFSEVQKEVPKQVGADTQKICVKMKEITLPPVLVLKQEKLKSELNKIESENKEVNGRKQTHSVVFNKNINESNTSQTPPKTNKFVEMSRIPLHENKIIKRNLVVKPRKINTLVKNSSNPKIIYEINSQDGFITSSSCLVEAWQKVFEAVQAARAEKRLPPLPQNPFVSDLRTLGLDNNSVKYLVEQLPGVGHCGKYKPVYHKPRIPLLGDHMVAPQENITGCARSEPFRTRNKYDMFSWLASRHRRPPKLLVNSDSDIVNGNSRRATSLNLPMAMRFRHLKETSRESVGVFRSDIHGRGLFCLRDIDSGEMVIEYAGEVVRSGLTDKRERYYTSKGIGCYMFRIDDQFVVDATMRGNAARFINHSCEPNCYSRVVDILGKKHILIFALRRIPQGEELTYDYKFPLEDDKITCHCLSRKCRKYLN